MSIERMRGSSMSIVEFLRARLDEDEAVAQECVVDRLRVHANRPGYVDKPDYDFIAWTGDYPTAVVIVGPERVLREVEAKRRIVDRIETRRLRDNLTTTLIETLIDLASVYADHPDYDPEWSKG